MKKVLAAFLAILTVVTAFCACKKEPSDAKESGDNSDPVSNEYTPDVPDSDFSGATFTIMCRDPEMAWGELAIVTDEESTTVLGDASYKRNRRLEYDYNIKLNFITYNDAGQSGDSFYNTLFQNLQAYDDICDICMPGIIDAATLASSSAFYDLSSGDVPYVNLEQPWWNKSLNESIAILNRQYFAISDALLNDKLDTYVMFFNKTLFADNNLEEPYALVDSGEWTFDAFADIVKTYGGDVNGNGSPDYEDNFGFVGFIYDVFYVGSGIRGATLNKETGLPEMTRFSDKIDNIYQKAYALIKGTNLYYTYSVGQEPLYNNDVNDTFAVAFDTKSLFMCGPLMFYFNIITNMTSDVGVLPCPKYDENQSSYYHRAGYNGSTVMTVLTTVKDTSYMQTTNPWGASLASDFSGERNYVKELCVTLPSSMARNRENGNCLMLVHLSPEINVEFPVGDDVIVNDEVQYGSIGYSFDSTLALDFVYPSSEGPVTYEREGAEWRRKYHSVKAGNSHGYSVSLIPGHSDSYSGSMIESYKKAYSLYAPSVTADIDIDKVYSQQIEIYRALYTEYESARGEKSAGVYFDASVRTGKPYSPVSYLIGFSGAQTAVAYEMFREGILSEDKDLLNKGIAMLDFWSSETIVGGELPIVWWIPDENAPLSGTVQNYANYLRVFVDGMESMLDACIFGKKNGYDVSEWKAAALKTADFLVENQSAEGTWARAYTRDGKPLKTVDDLDRFHSSTIFNGYAGESPLASYCAVRFLYKAYQITGEEKYKTAAIRTAEWAYDTLYLEIGKYVSICPDHVNICDKESAIYAMYCFGTAYEMTGNEKYLKGLEHAAISAMSFVFVYDYAVPYSVSAEYDEVNVFKNGGVIGQSLIATGYGHIDAYAAHIYYDFFDYYVLTGDSIYLDFAGFIQINTKLQSDYDGSKNWYFEGMNLEACYVSGNMFTTAGDGVWLPWVSHSFIDPVIDMRERYGDADVYALSERFSREELLRMRG